MPKFTLDIHPDELSRALDEKIPGITNYNNMKKFLHSFFLERFPQARWEKKLEFRLRVTKKPKYPNEPALLTLEFPANANELKELVSVLAQYTRRAELGDVQ